jgi:Protein of unknown function (DUF3168)
VFTVTGSPLEAFADAIGAALAADAAFLALATGGIFASVPEGSRATMPYVVLANRTLNDQGGAMQLAGGQAAVQVDFWSGLNTPHEVQALQSRARVVLHRQPVVIVGFAMMQGSLTCEEELVFQDFDPDMPKRSLYHGVQRWIADLEEVS